MSAVKAWLRRSLDWIVEPIPEPEPAYVPKHRADGTPVILWGRR